MRLVAGSLLFCLLAAVPAAAQETDILEDEKWYQLEETVFGYEMGAMHALGDGAQCLEADTARWRAALDAACRGDACREATFLDRIATLHGLQPSAGQMSGELPAVPELVAVVAPEDDEAQTPKDHAAAPDFAATGTLVQEYDDPEHSGLALQSEAGGDKHVLVFLMELGNQVSHDVLMNLAGNEPGRRYLVRGGRAEAADGIANFRPDQCRFVYNLPG
jgi:hypothetical protein